MLKDYYNSGDDGNFQINNTAWKAQTFLTTSAYDIASVKLKLWRSPTNAPGTVTVEIWGITSTKPDNTKIYATGTTNGDTLPTTSGAAEWREITFSTPYSLSDATLYSIVVYCSGTGSASLNWRSDAVSSYTDGKGAFSSNSGSTWTLYANADAMFETYSAPVYAEFSGSSDGISDIDGTLVEAVIHAFSGSFGSVSSLSGTWGFSTSVLLTGLITGISVVSATILIHPAEGWPPTRFEDYDPDKFWDEETETWTDAPTIGPGSRIEHLIVVGEQGEVYFGEV